MMLERERDGQLDWSYEKWNITKCQGVKEHTKYNKIKKANLVGHILRRNYLPKHVIKDEKDGKTRKKS